MTLSAENTKPKGLEQYIDAAVLAYLERQQGLFDASRTELFKAHPRQFVWFEDGMVLDADIDEDALFERVMGPDPDRMVFIAQVLETEPQRMVRYAVLGQG
ncbi:hypothetical protein IQ266_21115 [filamentous cyanobacterium LEGE 11480]|uniref:Uncharacterized protein n=1 Tax=Romeriopsis navalis LEGE 11480 TaxID=2777977 RepID=A0A928VTF2_9CYAN|nr:hypothetical protein [Romeriopsis navalis]MBE9032245.1 hypothetical protein [Romeriopsis navalis LEGE 11480]